MVFDFLSRSKSHKLKDVLEGANKYLKLSFETDDPKKGYELSQKAKSKIEDAAKIMKSQGQDRDDGIANLYRELGRLLDKLDHHDEAQECHKDAETWGNI